MVWIAWQWRRAVFSSSCGSSMVAPTVISFCPNLPRLAPIFLGLAFNISASK
jgi:hypothetical protein